MILSQRTKMIPTASLLLIYTSHTIIHHACTQTSPRRPLNNLTSQYLAGQSMDNKRRYGATLGQCHLANLLCIQVQNLLSGCGVYGVYYLESQRSSWSSSAHQPGPFLVLILSRHSTIPPILIDSEPVHRDCVIMERIDWYALAD